MDTSSSSSEEDMIGRGKELTEKIRSQSQKHRASTVEGPNLSKKIRLDL